MTALDRRTAWTPGGVRATSHRRPSEKSVVTPKTAGSPHRTHRRSKKRRRRSDRNTFSLYRPPPEGSIGIMQRLALHLQKIAGCQCPQSLPFLNLLASNRINKGSSLNHGRLSAPRNSTFTHCLHQSLTTWLAFASSTACDSHEQ